MKRHVVLFFMLSSAALALAAQTASSGDRKVFHRTDAPVLKDTGGAVGAFPDVAETPPSGPAGPVPIPYPNVDKEGDSTKGRKGAKPVKKLSPGGIKESFPAEMIVPLVPKISHLSPLGCFVAGDRVSIGGRNFGGEQGSRKLVLSYPVNRSRNISRPKWSNEQIMFTMPPGVPFNATGRIGIYEGMKTLDESEIFFCREDHGMPVLDKKLGPKTAAPDQTEKFSPHFSKGVRPAIGVSKRPAGWSAPAWMEDGAVEEEKSSGDFGRMVMKKPPAMVPEDQSGPPLTDPQVLSLTAVCTDHQRIAATVKIANATGIPTAVEAKTEVSVIAKKRKPSKSPTPIWEDVKVVLEVHTTGAGFTGQETFTVEKAVPYFGNPIYTVRAKLSISEGEESSSNNNMGKTVHCTW